MVQHIHKKANTLYPLYERDFKKKQNLINLANFDAVSLFFQNYCMKFNTLKYCVGEECRKVKRIMNYGRISNSRLTLVCCNLQEKDCYVNIKRLYR